MRPRGPSEIVIQIDSTIKAFELVKHAQRRRPAFAEEFLLPRSAFAHDGAGWKLIERSRRRSRGSDDVAGMTLMMIK